MSLSLAKLAAVFIAVAPVVAVVYVVPPSRTVVPMAQPTATPTPKRAKKLKWQQVGPLRKGQKFMADYVDSTAGELIARGTYSPDGAGPDGSTQYDNGSCTVIFSGLGNEGWWLIQDPDGLNITLYDNPSNDPLNFPLTGWAQRSGTAPPPEFSGASSNNTSAAAGVILMYMRQRR